MHYNLHKENIFMESLLFRLQEQKYCFWNQLRPSFLTTSILSKNIYAVGFIDHIENSNLIVGCSPSYTSLSIEEVDESGTLTPLDIPTTVYESSICSCCLNDSSSTVCLSTVDCNSYLWDIHTHSNVHSFHSESSISDIQRYIDGDTWIGRENDTLVLIDSQQRSIRRFNEFSNVHSYSVSNDRNMIAISTASKVSIVDIRFLHTPLYTFSLPSEPSVRSMCWNHMNTVVSLNCGISGIYLCSLPSMISHAQPPTFIPVPNNELNHWNAFVDDLLVVGSDNGRIACYDHSGTLLKATTLSKSPIMSIVPLCHSSLSSSFLASTDTELSLLSLQSSPFNFKDCWESELEEEPDVVRLDEQPEAEEWMLQGVQSEYSRCSYDQFGACRQQVFVCRTCRDQYDRLLHLQHPEWSQDQIQSQYDVGMVCEQCAHFCHTLRGHDVVALGVKNQVTCDCGNDLFRRLDLLAQTTYPELSIEELPAMHTCSLYPNKANYNRDNHYTHNCRERYCYCDREEELPMVQCVRCCDWFHNQCASERYKQIHPGKWIDLNDESIDFICEACETCEPIDEPAVRLQIQENKQTTDETPDTLGGTSFEDLIRMHRKKNDRAGAMKMIMRYMLEKSLSQSASSQRAIIVETDVDKAKKELEKIVQKLKKEK